MRNLLNMFTSSLMILVLFSCEDTKSDEMGSKENQNDGIEKKSFMTSFYTQGYRAEAFDGKETKDNGYIIAGYFLNQSGNSRGWLIKTNLNGIAEWTNKYNISDQTPQSSASFRSVQETADDGYILAGSGGSPGNGLLIKTDKSGNKVWEKTFSYSYSYFHDVVTTSDNGYFAVGNNESGAWFVKTDVQGNVLWENNYLSIFDDGISSQENIPNSVLQTSDGEYLITGEAIKPSGSNFGSHRHIWTIKLDGSGNKLWESLFDYSGSYNNSGKSIKETSDGGYIIAGKSQEKGWLIKYDGSGNLKWAYDFGDNRDEFYDVYQTLDGGYIVTGRTDAGFNSDGLQDTWLLKTNSLGIKEWEKVFTNKGGDVGRKVQETSDGGFMIVGTMYINNGDRAVLIKTDAEGNFPADSTSEQKIDIQ